MDNVQRFLRNGGKITVCKPCEKIIDIKPKKRVWHAPQNGHDKAVCADCLNKGRCTDPCAPLKWIDGDVPLREKILKSDINEYDYEDYNAVLAAKISHTREINGEMIRSIANIKKKAIIILLDSGFKISDVSRFFRCSIRTIYRIKEKT